MRKVTMWFLNRFNINRAVQAQKTTRGWKFGIYKGDELYYRCRENKGADQLHNTGKLICALVFAYAK